MPGSALKKRVIAGSTAPDATQNTRGLVSLASENKIIAALQVLRNGQPVQYPQTPEAVGFAELIEALEYLFTQPMPVRAKWDFRQSMKVSTPANLFLRTNGLQELDGVSAIPYESVSGGPVVIPPLKNRGNFTLTNPLITAQFPVGLASAAVGATQTGNGSGDANTVAAGDFWKLTNAGLVGPNAQSVAVDTLLIARVNNPGNVDENWIIADLES